MAHDYEKSKKLAVKIISILAIITVVEVLIALTGKGYIVSSWHFPGVIIGGFMILFSLIKAYLIIYEFMHMKYEVSGLVKSVLLPVFLLVWGIIAFLYEGSAWNNNRQVIRDKDKEDRFVTPAETGMIYQIEEKDLR